MFNRRGLIKKSIALASALPLLQVDKLTHRAEAAESLDVGEIYGDFVIIPQGNPVPSFVNPPKFGVPVICQSTSTGLAVSPTMTPIIKEFASYGDIHKYVNIPLYNIDVSSRGFQEQQGSVVSQPWGEIATVSFDFAPIDGSNLRISIGASTQFPRPYPIWFDPTKPIPDVPAQPEKVNFLPTPGLQVASGYGLRNKPMGYSFYWISKGILYWLIVEDYSSRQQSQALAMSL